MPAGSNPHLIVAETAPLLRRSSWEHIGEEPFFRAVQAQTAGHLTGSEAQGGCKSLVRLSCGDFVPLLCRSDLLGDCAFGARGSRREGRLRRSESTFCGDSSRVELECATLEIRVRFPVTAPRQSFCHSPGKGVAGRAKRQSLEIAVRQGMVGPPHKRVRDGSTPSTATTTEVFQSRIRDFESLG